MVSVLSPVFQARSATCFTLAGDGSGRQPGVFLRQHQAQDDGRDARLAVGVMIAASFWSLLAPAIEMSRRRAAWPVPAMVGCLSGGVFLWGRQDPASCPSWFSRKGGGGAEDQLAAQRAAGPAITCTTIPEGLAGGWPSGGSGGLALGQSGAAFALAIGNRIQTFSGRGGGLGTSAREGMSRLKSFWYAGSCPEPVEPVARVLGGLRSLPCGPCCPNALSFAAGAMILCGGRGAHSDHRRRKHSDVATIGVMARLRGDDGS